MPTRQQIEAAEEQRKRRAVGLVANILTTPGSAKISNTTGGVAAAVVGLVGNLGIGLWQFLSGKAYAKKVQKRKTQISQAHSFVDQVLEQIEAAGYELIEEGEQPGTTAFEASLKQRLYHKVGYKGQCDADVWAPGTERLAQKGGRPVSFYVTGRGTILHPAPGFQSHPFLQSYWTSRCRNIRDGWVEAAVGRAKQEGQVREVEDLEASIAKGKKVVGLVTGGISIILLILMITYAVRMET